MEQTALNKCKEQIKKHEGLRLEAYKDSLGNLTIGYGHLIGGEKLTKITKEQAEAIFEKDFTAATKIAKDFMGDPEFRHKALPSDYARYAVVVNMAFNMGNKLKTFKKMKAALDKSDYEKASVEMLDSLWAKQVKTRATALAKQMKTGEW